MTSAFSPDFKFRDHIRDDVAQDDQPKKLILKRDRETGSLEEVRSLLAIKVSHHLNILLSVVCVCVRLWLIPLF